MSGIAKDGKAAHAARHGAPGGRSAAKKRKAYWLKQLHRWHWISAALSLIGMLLFALTGITLNHAGQIESHADVVERVEQLPADLRDLLASVDGRDGDPLPPPVTDWFDRTLSLDLEERPAEWLDGEVYVPLPRPGGDAWISVALDSGEVRYEATDRGWIALLNDLHKGRNTGDVWSGFLDVFAVACLVFCITGLFLLQLHGGNRPATWPLVGLGLAAPLLLVLFFLHP